MPFTLFCPQSSPDAALRFLREHGAAVEGDATCWNAGFAMGGDFLKRQKTITFTYDKEWCSPPNWPRQLFGMTNFLRQSFEMTDETRRAVTLLVSRFEFSIGIITEPEISVGNDQRLEIIHALASHLDCVVFTPSALCDARLRAFAQVNGKVDDDAKIPWGRKGEPPPSVEASPSGAEDGDDEGEEELQPPTAARVARRLYAIIAVVARALFDMNTKEGRDPAYSLEELRVWATALALDTELEPEEKALLEVPERRLNDRQIIDGVWRIEGAAMLAWALNLAPRPDYDLQVDVDDLLRAIGFLDAERCRGVVGAPSLRSSEDLEKCSSQMLAYHWRMVDFGVRPEKAEFEKVAIFGGPFDLSWAKIVEGDLSLRGKPISKADRSVVSHCSSISLERLRAANWLVGYATVYSETPTDT
jgi:hypothetical protein